MNEFRPLLLSEVKQLPVTGAVYGLLRERLKKRDNGMIAVYDKLDCLAVSFGNVPHFLQLDFADGLVRLQYNLPFQVRSYTSHLAGEFGHNCGTWTVQKLRKERNKRKQQLRFLSQCDWVGNMIPGLEVIYFSICDAAAFDKCLFYANTLITTTKYLFTTRSGVIVPKQAMTLMQVMAAVTDGYQRHLQKRTRR